jgi:hypothetical protein
MLVILELNEGSVISNAVRLGLQVAVSPTGCSFVQISCDRKVKWKTLTHDIDPVVDPVNNSMSLQRLPWHKLIGSKYNIMLLLLA